MNIFIFSMISLSGVAAFSPFQLPNGIFANGPVKKDDDSAAGRIFFQKKNIFTSVTAVTVTSTIGSYSTCYCYVTPLTPCPTNRKKKQMPWIFTEPYVVEPLAFQISGSQPELTQDFNPYPRVLFYNLTYDEAEIGVFPKNPNVTPQWPFHLVSYERAQNLPVEYRLQSNEDRYNEGFLNSPPKRYTPDKKKRPEGDGVAIGTDVESSMSQNDADTEGRSFTFNINTAVVSTFTITTYVSTLAGTQQLAVACIASGANFPGPACTNTCSKLIIDLCQGLGNALCTSSGTGVCDSRTGLCTCDPGFTLAANGKCVVCATNGDCAGTDTTGTCDVAAGTCKCAVTNKATGKCDTCAEDKDCPVVRPAEAVCFAGSCFCLNRELDTGTCVVCIDDDHCGLDPLNKCTANLCVCANGVPDAFTGVCDS